MCLASENLKPEAFFIVCFFFFFFRFWDRASLCTLGFPGAHCMSSNETTGTALPWLRGRFCVVEKRKRIARGIWGSLPWLPLGQREKQRERTGRGADAVARATGPEKIGKNGGRVLLVIRGSVEAEEGRLAGTAWEPAWALICWRLVWTTGPFQRLGTCRTR